MTWPTLHTFVTNENVRAEYFQGLWEALYLLKNPLLTAQFNTGGGNTTWSFSTTADWFDIDTAGYQTTFESMGNPLLVWAIIRAGHSASGGDVQLRFTVDGVGQGNVSGQGFFRNITQPETRTLSDIITSAGAGEHTIGVQINNQTVGNGLVYQYQCHGLFVMEL